MFCQKCGANLPENTDKCPSCGEENAVAPIPAPTAKKSFSKKNIIVIIIIAVILIAGGITAAVVLSGGSSVSMSSSDMLQIADKYLKEMNYEQAIVEFQKVLEIEPKNVDAYIGLADAYIALGDDEKAIEILREGFKITGDPVIEMKLKELTEPAETEAPITTTEITESVYGSMGSVIILGQEFDIATTTILRIVNMSKLTEVNGLYWIYYEDGMGRYGFQIDYFDDFEIKSNEPISSADIKNISELKNLQSLTIFPSDITDITPLAGLTNLTGLELCGNQITDITPLAGLTNLIYLNLYGNQITDITPLAGLTNLTYLGLEGNQITDVTPLAGLTNLITLDLEGNQITGITPLAGLTNLITLDLGGNQITDISPLAGLTNLTGLELYGNQIMEAQIDQLRSQLPNCNIH